jgi:hypothetical protein
MPLFSKNGSIPKPTTDGTNGWVLVPEMPACPDGKEVVWLNWEWLVRDPKPTDREGYQWNWNHGDKAWVECALATQVTTEPVTLTTAQLINLTTAQLSNLTTTGL